MKDRRENLSKLLKFIEEICNMPDNEWFKKELISKLDTKTERTIPSAITEIYEYCIKLILKDHAEKFYEHFKILDIKEKLINDFIRMEKFRREGKFEDFCLAAFQQFEAIVNILLNESLLQYIKLNKDESALLRFDKDSKIYVRRGYPPIGNLIFQTNDIEKINTILAGAIKDWNFNKRYRAVLYYYYFNKEIKGTVEQFEKIYALGDYLYQGRNLNHRGSFHYPHQQEILDKILPNQHKYYFKFLGFLEDFVSGINSYL